MSSAAKAWERGYDTVPGHWEVGLRMRLERWAIGAVVEGTTRPTMLVHLPREKGYHRRETLRHGPAQPDYGAFTAKTPLPTP